MNKIKFYLALSIMLLSNSIFASDNNIKQYDEKMNLSLRYQFSSLLFFVSSDNDDSKTIDYSSNMNDLLGINFTYDDIGFSYFYNLGSSGLSEKNGKTEMDDMQMFYYGKTFGIDLYYQDYHGFYIDNPEDFDSTWKDGDPYPQRNDLEIKNIGGNLHYINSGDFSYKAAFNQSENQIKSGGSLLIKLTPVYTKIKSNYSLIPDNQKIYFAEESGFKGGEFISVYAGIGYAYTLTKFNFFITPMAYLSLGYQYQNYNLPDGKKKNSILIPGFDLKLSAGYNGDNYYAGIWFFNYNTTIMLEKTQMQIMNTCAQIFIGRRF